jgi:hypothetical protein
LTENVLPDLMGDTDPGATGGSLTDELQVPQIAQVELPPSLLVSLLSARVREAQQPQPQPVVPAPPVRAGLALWVALGLTLAALALAGGAAALVALAGW